MSVQTAAAAPTATDAHVAVLLDDVHAVVQPIIDVATGAPVAYEALARFGPIEVAVDQVIAAAHTAGAGDVVEAACIRAALARRAELPDGVLLAVNVSPDMLGQPAVARCWPRDLDGVIVEVTEHHSSAPQEMLTHVAELRRRGARIAIDDVGTGYAGLLRLGALRPDFVKVDRSVVAGVLVDDAHAAVLEALVTLSHRMHAVVIGEGVETVDDLRALAAFDVDCGQGFGIGRPTRAVEPINPLIRAACHHARSLVLGRTANRNAAATRAGGMYAVVSTVSCATDFAELRAAAGNAARTLAVDTIGVSTLGPDGWLHEITAVGADIDRRPYDLADYPVTRAVLDTGETREVHVNDPDADPAERRVLEQSGYASLLMVPLSIADRPIGVLELRQRTHRRWTSPDIVHGYGLAAHLGNALYRLQQ